ncbi:Zinc knuckle family protein, putative isoform 1 [Theobroma cacao]|uniref:Zinc knuckle family protein, putative isoform 1 n=1 Tax=Theobroma cacao TaxID=3641 RepID=A0A061E8W3_THECC|nr:Zinc knuckle family protein, putative isoform 1 [Theobroma cacao]
MENTNSAPTGCYKCGRTGHWSSDCPDTPKSDRPNVNPNPGRVATEKTNSAATGCYKCGRPGHWSRDCPDAPKSDQPNLKDSSTGANFTPEQLPRPEKPKKVSNSRIRPKLTPELLLSDDGFGYILRHFPRVFKYHGRGHEVSDLGKLIGLYREWHRHLLPYYSFEQFVHKTDKVASSKRVKNCIRELRERVARGGDPTKLHESPDENNGPSDEQGARHSERQTHDQFEGDHYDDIEENMLNEIYQKATESSLMFSTFGLHKSGRTKEMPVMPVMLDSFGELYLRAYGGEPSHDIHTEMVAAEVVAASSSGPEHQVPNNGAGCFSEVHITDEQRAQMEANKFKALQRVAAGAGSSSETQITEEQRARMEANRMKALERAAARARSLQSA